MSSSPAYREHRRLRARDVARRQRAARRNRPGIYARTPSRVARAIGQRPRRIVK